MLSGAGLPRSSAIRLHSHREPLPSLVIHSFGKGKVIWSAAGIESSDHAVNAKLLIRCCVACFPNPGDSSLMHTRRWK